MDFAAYDVIHETACQGKTVVIVGEHHSDSRSADLVDSVIKSVQPPTVAIESGPTRWTLLNDAPSKGGRAAVSYARDNKNTVLLLDTEQDTTVTQLVDDVPLTESSDEKTPPLPAENGDISTTALRTYRDHVKQTQPERFEVIWTQREEAMARRLRGACEDDTIAGPIVCVVGASHAARIRDILQTIDTHTLTEARVLTFN